jgi:hypothetical protein
VAALSTTDGLWFQQPEDYHGRKPTARELREIFRLETGRGIGNDWVIRHEGGNLQLKPGSRRYGPTRSKALVCEWEDGTMEVYYRGEAIAFDLATISVSRCGDCGASPFLGGKEILFTHSKLIGGRPGSSFLFRPTEPKGMAYSRSTCNNAAN